MHNLQGLPKSFTAVYGLGPGASGVRKRTTQIDKPEGRRDAETFVTGPLTECAS